MRFISQKMRANIFVKVLAFTKIPLMFFCRPKIIKINDEQVIVKIPFKRKVKNHVNSMYFGVLSIGADVTGAMIAMDIIKKIIHKEIFQR